MFPSGDRAALSSSSHFNTKCKWALKFNLHQTKPKYNRFLQAALRSRWNENRVTFKKKKVSQLSSLHYSLFVTSAWNPQTDTKAHKCASKERQIGIWEISQEIMLLLMWPDKHSHRWKARGDEGKGNKASEIQSADKWHMEKHEEKWSTVGWGRWRDGEREGAFQQIKSISIKIQSSYSAICSKWLDWRGHNPGRNPGNHSTPYLNLSKSSLHLSFGSHILSFASLVSALPRFYKTHMLQLTLTCADCIVDINHVQAITFGPC